MSTRSRIGMQDTRGNIRVIYCHHDGYIKDGVGETLFRHYQDETKINALLDGGAIFCLGSRLDKPAGHPPGSPVSDRTIFYRRDVGEEGAWHDASEYHSLSAFIEAVIDLDAEYAYLYKNGEWFVCDMSEDVMEFIALKKELE